MNPKNSLTTDDGKIEKKQDANAPSHDTRIEEAETRTRQAEARTEQANTRTDQANTRTEQAEARSVQAILASELRYRRLFETALDGILILDADTGQVVDANPFMKDLLGYSQEEFLGRKLWEIGPFKGVGASKIAFAELQHTDRIRYEGLPLETKDGQRVEVEFISNAYLVEQKRLIQCNIRNITERRRIEEQTEEQLKASFKEIGDLKSALDEHAIVAITDPQGKITYVNDKFCAISKYSREELLGQDHRIINSGYHPKEFIGDLWTTITHGRVWHGEIKNKAKDGSFYWVDTTIVPFLNGRGEPRQYVAIRADITERKLAEERLNASLKEVSDLKTALDEHAIVAITNSQGKITDVNDKFCAISKYSREELLGQDHRIINSGYHPKEFIRDLWTTISHGKVWHGEIKNKAKDGLFYWVDTTIVPFLNDRGEPRQYVAIRADITERKLAEEKLNASLKEVNDLKTALDEHAIVAITNPQGKITDVNDKFCAISKYPREELLGQDHRIINSGYHPKEFIRDLWTTISHGKVWHGEIKNKAKDGSFYWVDTTIVPFLNDQGKPRQYVAIRADITERKAAEEKISQLNTGLEQRVDERTAQLQDANKELQAFSYSVSHDLRAPLRHVLGFVDQLKKGIGPSLSEENLDHLTTISEAAKRMGTLIDDLLAFSRVGRAELRKTDVNLDQLIRETMRDFQLETKDRNIAWAIHSLPTVQADRALLQMVLVNLISNAVKFTGTRTEAKIEIGCAPDENGKTVIFIRDNGAGFNPKYIQKLFGVFQRLHSHDEFEGTGIGLANVQRIIHRHGGRAWAEGVVDDGATFYFSIPKQTEA